MKRLVGLLAALVLAGGSIFAGDFYNGDIQPQLGCFIGPISYYKIALFRVIFFFEE